MTESDDAADFEVVLVQPNIIWVYDPFEHLGLAYLAASLRAAGFRVKIIDGVLQRLSMEELYQAIQAARPRVVGVTLISHGYRETVRLLDKLREGLPHTKIVGGGHFATFAAAKIMADTEVFDAIGLGEADLNLVDYCRHHVRGEPIVPGGFLLRGGEKTPSRPVELADLPRPARDMLPLAMRRGAHPSVASSRGCYARCSFCTVHSFYDRGAGKRWFGRPLDDIISELSELHARYQLRHFNFVDDNFVGPGPAGRRRVFEFADKYRASKLPMTFHIDCRASDVDDAAIEALVEVGLRTTFLGIESVSRRDLIDYRKGLKVECNWTAVDILRRHGVEFTLAMIMFNPKTDREAIIDNVNFLKTVRHYPRNPITMLNIYEGVDAANIYKDYVYGPFWDRKFRFAHAEIKDIHRAALDFCKQTLPLERVLAAADSETAMRRFELNRIRLYALGDLAAFWGSRSQREIVEPWKQAIASLHDDLRIDAVATTAEARFKTERLYIQPSMAEDDNEELEGAASIVSA